MNTRETTGKTTKVMTKVMSREMTREMTRNAVKLTSFKIGVAILGLTVAIACATEPQQPTGRQERKSYLDQISMPLTESWNSGVRTQVAKLKSVTASVPGDKLTTTVLGSVSSDGKVQSVQIVRSSGVKAVDELAIESFKRASPLPAPPPYVIRKGVASVHWDFNLKK